MQQCKTKRLDLAARNGILHGATRLATVPTIAETAFADEWPQLHECTLERIRRDVRKAEGFHSGRIDDPRAVA